MEQNFHWIHWIQRIWEITVAWIGFSIRNCSHTCVSVVQWLSLCLLHRRSWVPTLQFSFLILIFLSLNSANSVKAFRENSNVSHTDRIITQDNETIPHRHHSSVSLHAIWIIWESDLQWNVREELWMKYCWITTEEINGKWAEIENLILKKLFPSVIIIIQRVWIKL